MSTIGRPVPVSVSVGHQERHGWPSCSDHPAAQVRRARRRAARRRAGRRPSGVSSRCRSSLGGQVDQAPSRRGPPAATSPITLVRSSPVDDHLLDGPGAAAHAVEDPRAFEGRARRPWTRPPACRRPTSTISPLVPMSTSRRRSLRRRPGRWPGSRRPCRRRRTRRSPATRRPRPRGWMCSPSSAAGDQSAPRPVAGTKGTSPR